MKLTFNSQANLQEEITLLKKEVKNQVTYYNSGQSNQLMIILTWRFQNISKFLERTQERNCKNWRLIYKTGEKSSKIVENQAEKIKVEQIEAFVQLARKRCHQCEASNIYARDSYNFRDQRKILTKKKINSKEFIAIRKETIREKNVARQHWDQSKTKTKMKNRANPREEINSRQKRRAINEAACLKPLFD